MESYRPEVMISEDEISLRIEALGQAITDDYAGEEIVVNVSSDAGDGHCGIFPGAGQKSPASDRQPYPCRACAA